MGKQRKKTLQELMQERATGTGNQSVYTTEPRKTYGTSESVKTQVNNLYKRNQTKPTNTWDKVVNKTKDIMNDVGIFAKNTGLGAERGVYSALGQTEFMSQQKSDLQRNLRQRQTEAKFALSNPTAEQRLERDAEKMQGATLVNGVLVKKRPSINDSDIMKTFNKKQEEVDQKIFENTEKTKTSLGEYYAGNVAPSMGQSLVGTGLDLLAPRKW